MGTRARAEARHHFVRARAIRRPETFPWPEFQEIARELLDGQRRIRAAVRPDARLPAAARGHRRHHGRARRRRPRSSGCWSRTGSQQGLDLVARVLVDPGDVVLVELPTYTGAITAFRNVQAEMVGVPQEADGIDLEATRRGAHRRLTRAGPAHPLPVCRPELSRTRPGC